MAMPPPQLPALALFPVNAELLTVRMPLLLLRMPAPLPPVTVLAEKVVLATVSAPTL